MIAWHGGMGQGSRLTSVDAGVIMHNTALHGRESGHQEHGLPDAEDSQENDILDQDDFGGIERSTRTQSAGF